MKYLMSTFLLLQGATAAVLNHRDVPIATCENIKFFEDVTHQEGAVRGSHPTVGSITCPATDPECSLTHSNSYSVTVGVNVGASLGLELGKIFKSAGLDAGYTHSETKGTIDGGTSKCPKGAWTCGLKLTPWVSKANGKLRYRQSASARCNNPGGQVGDDEDFEVEFPEVTDGKPHVDVSICACKNADGWADEGAPQPCPMDC